MIWLLLRPKLLVMLIVVGAVAASMLGIGVTSIINDLLNALGLDWSLAF
jgi:hypothetical protein